MSVGVVKVGLLGLGTVGGGVIKTIRSQQEKLSSRLGKRIEIVKALVRDSEKERAVHLDRSVLTTDFEDVLKSDVDIVVEVMGGVDPTYDYVRALIEKGCHVVTANKELLAKRGTELVDLANQHQVHLAYEASVAGGIPILSVLRQFLRTNDISGIRGILNGTTNFILTKMETEQLSYQEVLKQAQELGYAEADPRSDVEGFDAMYKLYILAQLVYGECLPLAEVNRKGIADLTAGQIRIASELGYRIKLIAQANQSEEGIRLSVEPTMLPTGHPLAQIHDAFNAVQLSGNIVGDLLFTGRGAGELPTASAVVEDLAYLLTQPFTPHPTWKESDVLRVTEQLATAQSLCYLEGSAPAATPDRVLHFLRLAGVEVHKLKVQFDLGGVLRAGLITTGLRDEHEELLRSDFGLQVRCFPLLGTAE
ncbi:homoserine dehydrogenase [Brevibacillus choshinensis]|uniref:Homoserine dehydrogenase n=1 Tax=Brevibacillus choshinensis TaxID=54911 RepID=A0ABR5N133_BRECH|nr:homoserine dehydrogenase [Brevibacillus choshinensis]KQL44205.1 homoserine dehydrogenase [Brevibacillus choshinensis]